MWVRSTVLQELVARYERLRAQPADVQAEPAVQDLLRDTSYTLCVATGTRDVDAALLLARARIAETADGQPAVEFIAGPPAQSAIAEPAA